MSEPAAAAAAAPVVPVTAAQKTSFEDDVVRTPCVLLCKISFFNCFSF